MDDLFAPPDTAWQRVSPSLARMRRTLLAVATVLMLLVVAAAKLLLDLPLLWVAPPTALVLALAAVGWWLIGRNARRWGYAERDDDLYITRGALFRTLVVVPYGRMQFVDVQAGPLDQRFGIASVTLHTASTETAATIPGLPTAEAARLRDRLTEMGESHGAGL